LTTGLGIDPADLADPTIATELLEAFATEGERDQENWDSLGVSAGQVGEECVRKLWYGFRWLVPAEIFKAKTMRIFETGNIWEDRIIAMFRATCREVWDVDSNGEQFKARLSNGFVRGKCDIVVRGVPGMPDDEVFIVEVKSMNQSGFNSTKKHGIRKAKPTYFGQIQVYLRHFNMKRGLLACVNKNTDEMHVEVVDRDDGYMNVKLANVQQVITSKSPPPRVSDKADGFMCRFCNFKEFCHESKRPARRTCRNCIHGTAVNCDNKYPIFQCGRTDTPMDTELQKTGCGYHLFEPSLMPGEIIATDEENETITYEIDGKLWVDGDVPF